MEMKLIRPGLTDDVLINPNMGFTTFQHFAGDDLFGEYKWTEHGPENFDHSGDPPTPPGQVWPAAERFPETSISYCRWYWSLLEPERGKYNLEIIEKAAASAAARGQTLDLRIMPHNETSTVPEWYRAGAGAGKVAQAFVKGGNWMPDYDDPAYLECFGGLVRAAGERFDGDPRINMVDMGIFGHWGEWHRGDKEMGSVETRIKGVDLFLEAWPKTPKAMLIGAGPGLAHSFRNGCGWRADCWGDMGGFSPTWDHMHDSYTVSLAEAGGEEAWKQGFVSFEVCWTMQKWHDEGWDIDYIVDQALRWHVTSVNLKSAPVPEDYWPHVELMQKRMGYRIAPRTVRWADEAKAGGALTLNSIWENQGVAPPYHGYGCAARLKGDAGEHVLTIAESTADWMPGYHVFEQELELPGDIKPGSYALQLALVSPHSGEACVKLACDLPADGLWYGVGEVTITPA